MSDLIRCRIDSTGFPSVERLDLKKLADTLGWNPSGEHVAKIWAALERGDSVEVSTKNAGPRDVAGVTYRIYPLAESEDGLAIPASHARCVRY